MGVGPRLFVEGHVFGGDKGNFAGDVVDRLLLDLLLVVLFIRRPGQILEARLGGQEPGVGLLLGRVNVANVPGALPERDGIAGAPILVRREAAGAVCATLDALALGPSSQLVDSDAADTERDEKDGPGKGLNRREAEADDEAVEEREDLEFLDVHVCGLCAVCCWIDVACRSPGRGLKDASNFSVSQKLDPFPVEKRCGGGVLASGDSEDMVGPVLGDDQTKGALVVCQDPVASAKGLGRPHKELPILVQKRRIGREGLIRHPIRRRQRPAIQIVAPRGRLDKAVAQHVRAVLGGVGVRDEEGAGVFCNGAVQNHISRGGHVALNVQGAGSANRIVFYKVQEAGVIQIIGAGG